MSRPERAVNPAKITPSTGVNAAPSAPQLSLLASGRGIDALLAEEARLSQLILDARFGADSAEPVTAEVYLRVFAVRAAITHTLTWGCQDDVREAIEAGATWQQIAAARAVTPAQARADFRRWAQAQGALWDSGTDSTGRRSGLDPLTRRTVLALANRDEPPTATPNPEPLPKRIPDTAPATRHSTDPSTAAQAKCPGHDH